MTVSYTFWNRLEPSPRTASPDPRGVSRALAAEVHDPLWFLTRQWQLGELRGEDAASPAWIELTTHAAIDATWRVSDKPADDASLLTVKAPQLPAMPLERALLEEPEDGDDLSLSVELAQTFEALLRERSGDASDAAFVRWLRVRFPLRVPDGDDEAARFARVCARRGWDGVALARLAASGESWRTLEILPTDAQRAALGAFFEHVRVVYGSITSAPPRAWRADRLSYEATVGLAAPRTEAARLRVHPGSDGTVDWYSADATRAEGFGVARTRTFAPANVRFRGMPNARFWDFESSRSNLGDLTVDLRDLGRLAVMDFMLVHGNDWFMVPLPMHVGTACRVASLRVHDVFGEVTTVERAEEYSRGWSMFSTSAPDEVVKFFHLPATSSFTAQQGPVREEVRFLRDEGANLAWAVEETVSDAIGVPRSARERADVQRRAHDDAALAPAPRDGSAPPVAQYTLQTDVPAYWYPLVPERASDGTVRLREGVFVTSAQTATPAEGRLLGEGTPLVLRSDAVPDGGVRVVRRRMASRWIDGSLHVWTQRVALPGASDGSSGLRYDALSWRMP